MADPSPLLGSWAPFYTIVGSAAAALTGLMFVVITLITGRSYSSHEGIATCSTPTVLHFSAALLVAVVLGAPWHSFVAPSVLVTILGVYGLVHIVQVMARTRRLSSYHPDLEDYVFYTALPFAGYAAVSAGALALVVAPAPALYAVATGSALLIFVGIRNSWDTVTFIAIDQARDEDEKTS